MRKLAYLLIIALLSASCEKSAVIPENEDVINRIPGNPNTSFDRQILNDYFVLSIDFDSRGNAWIGTFRQGLIKYSTSETILYNASNSPIPEDAVIRDIAIDSKDNIWIGSESLIKFDGNDFTLYNSQNTPMPEDLVNSIAIDSKDNVWFTSCRFRQGGIVKFDGNTWEVFTPENSDLPVHFVQSIAIDQNDAVWLALNEVVTNTYLVKISGNQWTSFTSEDLGFSPYYLGNIDMNSYNEVCASIDYSLSSSFIHSGPAAFVFNGTSSIPLELDSMRGFKSLMVDNEDNIWCTTYQGFAVYNWESWTLNDSIFKEFGSFTIEQAPDDHIWIGTGNGIFINE